MPALADIAFQASNLAALKLPTGSAGGQALLADFIRRYLPQLAGLPHAALHAPWMARPLDLAAAGIELGRDYPLPLVAHDAARERTLAHYAVVKRPAASTAA